MLRQDDSFAGRIPPPPLALPIRYVLAWKVQHVRLRVQTLRLKYDGVGWMLLTCVSAVGVGVLVGHL